MPNFSTTVLLVSPRREDHASLENVFRGSHWNLQGAWTAGGGLQIIRRKHNHISVVICDSLLPDGDWKTLLAELEQVPVRPSLIVCSRLADERLWVEVLNLGGYDLLRCAPFVPNEVLGVTQSAFLAWKNAGRSSAIPLKTAVATSRVHDGAIALAAGSI